jgi:hypothetical protein
MGRLDHRQMFRVTSEQMKAVDPSDSILKGAPRSHVYSQPGKRRGRGRHLDLATAGRVQGRELPRRQHIQRTARFVGRR